MSDYKETYQSWADDKQAFWAKAAAELSWEKPWDQIFDKEDGPYGRWFKGAKCNSCYNCLDTHIKDRPGQAAIIYHSQMTNSPHSEVRTLTYEDLRDEVEAFASVLLHQGVTKGDRVIIYMPNIPEAAIAMLAAARIGAVHAVVFGGFAASELANRIDDCTPKLIIAASCGLEPKGPIAYKPLIDAAIEQASHEVDGTIIYQRVGQLQAELGARDKDWASLMAEAKQRDERIPCVSLEATDPLYILYTSGTTGKPKGVVRDNGGHMVALKWSMSNIYGIKPGETMWAASDVGWVVGHSYIVYGPLLQGATTIMYEGKPVGTPDASAFWQVIEQHHVNILFAAPTAIRAIKRDDPDGRAIRAADLRHFRALFLAGERADPVTIEWAGQHLSVPVIDHWWQTETAWSITAIPFGLEQLTPKIGSSNLPMPGYEIAILDDEGAELPRGETGAITIKLPLPPGCAPTLWQDDDRYRECYLSSFEGYYETADAGFMDEEGFIYVMGRTDDVINVAGHRLSTGAMEEVIATHKDVAECAVFGIKDQLKGQVPMGALVLHNGVTKDRATIEKEVVALVREKIGALAAFKQTVILERLPKTRSGKILRSTMRHIAEGAPFSMPATIEDPAIITEITTAFKEKIMLIQPIRNNHHASNR